MDSFKGFQQDPEEPFQLNIETIQRPGGHRTPKRRGGYIKWYQSQFFVYRFQAKEKKEEAIILLVDKSQRERW